MFRSNKTAGEWPIFESRTLTADEIVMVGGGLSEEDWTSNGSGGGSAGGSGGVGGSDSGGDGASYGWHGDSWERNENTDAADRTNSNNTKDTPESAAAREQGQRACDALAAGIKYVAEAFNNDTMKTLAKEVGPACITGVNNAVDAAYKTQIYEQNQGNNI